MQSWPVPLQAGGAQHSSAPGLIDCIARPDFGRRVLGRLNGVLPVAWWTVLQVSGDQPPRLCAQGSFDAPDIALDCWRIYRSGLYRHDPHFGEACGRARSAASTAVVTHCVADDFGRAQRERIYQAHSLSERLSLVSATTEPGDAARPLLAVNLYRQRAQPRFSAAEIDTVFALAGPLLAVVRRHVELCMPTPTPTRLSSTLLHDTDETVSVDAASSVQRLRQRCPALTERELAVCDRLLRGWTFDGIAADLGVSASTAKTYRNRGFERLGIHHRNELFALVMA